MAGASLHLTHLHTVDPWRLLQQHWDTLPAGADKLSHPERHALERIMRVWVAGRTMSLQEHAATPLVILLCPACYC